jgi:hypothetical protein
MPHLIGKRLRRKPGPLITSLNAFDTRPAVPYKMRAVRALVARVVFATRGFRFRLSAEPVSAGSHHTGPGAEEGAILKTLT